MRDLRTGHWPFQIRPLKRALVLGQEYAGNILAGIGVDHHEIDLTFGPVVNLIEAVRLSSSSTRMDRGAMVDRMNLSRIGSSPPGGIGCSVCFSRGRQLTRP